MPSCRSAASMRPVPSRGYWSDKKIDELVAAQRAESDPAKRRRIIGQIWKASAEFVPYVDALQRGAGLRDPHRREVATAPRRTPAVRRCRSCGK